MSQSSFSPGGSASGSAKLVIVALSLAIVTALVNYLYIQRVREEVREDYFTIYTLRRSVRPGDRFEKGDLEERRVPLTFKDAFETAITAQQLTTWLNDPRAEKYRRYAEEGDILTTVLFDDPYGTGEGKITPTPGRRLISLPVNSEQQPGSLRPQSHVDIAAAFPSGGSVPKVITVMENVELLAVGKVTAQDIEQREMAGERAPRLGRYKSITIEVRPEDVEMLHAISQFATEGFLLSLRAPDDPRQHVITNPDPNSDINPKVKELIREAEQNIVTATDPQFE